MTSVRPQNIENSSSHNANMALYPNIYTIPGRLNYNEDKVVRQMEAPIAYKLVLCRMQNYSVTPLAPEVMNVRLYRTKVEEADSHSVTTRLQRIFMHAVVRQLDHDGSGSRSQYDAYPCPERSPMDALIALEVSLVKPFVKQSSLLTKSSHVFLNILPQAIVDPQYLEGVVRILAYRYAERLEKLGVSTVELKIIERFNSEAPVISVRLVVENPTGYVVRVQARVDAVGHDEPVTRPTAILTACLSRRRTRSSSPSTRSVRCLRRCATRCTCTTSWSTSSTICCASGVSTCSSVSAAVALRSPSRP